MCLAMRRILGSTGVTCASASEIARRRDSRVTPQPICTLGKNSDTGGLPCSDGAAGLKSTRQRRVTSPSLLVTVGSGTLPVVSTTRFLLSGVMTTNSLRA